MIERAFNIRVHNPFSGEPVQAIPDRFEGIVSRMARSKTKAGAFKTGFPKRLKGVFNDSLNDPVPYCGDPQRAHLAIAFGYFYPSDRGRVPLVDIDLVEPKEEVGPFL